MAIRHADKLPLEYLGEKLFDKHCASCHDNPATHAPSREALSGFSKETVMIAQEFGKMQPMAAHLSKLERGLIAIYLAGSAPVDPWIEENRCTAASTGTTAQNTSAAGAWGATTDALSMTKNQVLTATTWAAWSWPGAWPFPR